MSAELKKLRIKAIENGVATTNPELMYDVLINPETYTIRNMVEYSPDPPPAGTTGKEQQYVRTQPPTLQFDFLFDSTGVVPKPLTGIAGALSNVPIAGAIASALSGAEKYDILKEIDKFKKIVYVYDGPSHSPRNVQLLWGTLLFEGVLTSLNFNFKLFQPDGTPIRVVATAAFTGTIEDDLRLAKEQSSSPDLTHIREIKSGDTLPLMAYNIYGDSSLYLEVARVNNLTNFRNLTPGETIFFPPVIKAKNG